MPGAGTDKTKNWVEIAGPVVVLVEPQLGENIGAAARVMANFGLSRLRLVAPRQAWPNPKASMMAAGADVSGNDAAHTTLGGQKLSNQQVVDILNEQNQEAQQAQVQARLDQQQRELYRQRLEIQRLTSQWSYPVSVDGVGLAVELSVC